MHVELEIKEDLSAELEELSRLCRIGNFAAAKHHYEIELKGHGRNALVHVHYAQLLRDSGDYKRLRSLERLDRSMYSGHTALMNNWTLIKSAGLLRTAGATSADCYQLRCQTHWQLYLDSENKCASTEVCH